MSFLINEAMAASETAKAAQTEGSFSLVMIVVISVLFYFMLIRPQNKRAKEHRDLVGKLKIGDEIVTSGGVLAKVSHVGDQYIKATIAEGLEISLQRNAVSTVLPKGTMKSL